MTKAVARSRAAAGNGRKFQKGAGGNKKGRPKGSPNKLTKTVRDVIAQAAEELGGHEGLVAWAVEDPKNRFAFWTSIYPKLLPLQVAGDRANPNELVHRRERLVVDPANPDR
jgi:hypothetical protein